MSESAAWPPTPEVVLSDNGVDVWRAALDEGTPDVLNAAAALLSAAERERAKRLRFEQDRRRFIIRRGFLRALLARYLGVVPAAVQLTCGAHGKPELAEDCPAAVAGIRFNCSHSRGLALYGVARGRRIGVDLEWVRPVPEMEEIARQHFTWREQQAIRAVRAADKLDRFFQAWTVKEACLKAIGDGLTRPLDQVEVDLASEGPVRLLAIGGDARGVAGWSACVIRPEPGYLATVVSEVVPGCTDAPSDTQAPPALRLLKEGTLNDCRRKRGVPRIARRAIHPGEHPAGELQAPEMSAAELARILRARGRTVRKTPSSA